MKITESRLCNATRLVVLWGILFTATSVMAQGSADVWLQRASSILQQKGVEIAFRINDDDFRMNGKLLMHGDSYLFDSPDMKIWFDGTTQWTLQIDGDFSELYISNPAIEDQQSVNPYLLLKNYQKSFTATDGGDKTINGQLLHKVMLTAKDTRQELAGLNVYLKGNGELAAMTLIFPDEREVKIGVRSLRNGLTFPKGTFTYSETEYPVEEVIDMR